MPLTYGPWNVTDDQVLAAALGFNHATLVNYDFGGCANTPESAPDSVTVCDIGRLVTGEMVGMKMKTAAALVAAGPNAPWSAVPHQPRLPDAAPTSDLYRATCQLLDHFDKVPGVGSAVATKLLSLKRPGLVPVIDRWVWEAYRDVAKRFKRQKVRWPTMAAIHEDLCKPGNVEGLLTLRTRLGSLNTPQARVLGRLSDLRLRDVVLRQRWREIHEAPGI